MSILSKFQDELSTLLNTPLILTGLQDEENEVNVADLTAGVYLVLKLANN